MNTWPNSNSDEPRLLAHAGIKAGCVQLVSIDDREKTPNYGKQIVSLGTVVVTPPLLVCGLRTYSRNHGRLTVNFDIYSKDLPKSLSKIIKTKPSEKESGDFEKKLKKTDQIFAIVAVFPNAAGISQKKPFIFEVSVQGGDLNKQFDYVKDLLGREIKFDQVFESGATVDAAGITKGKGWEGPVTRWGVKRKQHKSRKSVRAVGSLGPISPQYVMYTVPRAGQRGFHQRTEYNKRIMLMSNTAKNEVKINPEGGYKHFGFVKGDFIILKGSIPGTTRRFVKLRAQIRKIPSKIIKPNILEVVL